MIFGTAQTFSYATRQIHVGLLVKVYMNYWSRLCRHIFQETSLWIPFSFEMRLLFLKSSYVQRLNLCETTTSWLFSNEKVDLFSLRCRIYGVLYVDVYYMLGRRELYLRRTNNNGILQ